jgi:hypothetical protein
VRMVDAATIHWFTDTHVWKMRLTAIADRMLGDINRYS